MRAGLFTDPLDMLSALSARAYAHRDFLEFAPARVIEVHVIALRDPARIADQSAENGRRHDQCGIGGIGVAKCLGRALRPEKVTDKVTDRLKS